MHSPSTAILFFSRSAAAEARAKPLCRAASVPQRERLFQQLIHHTLAEVKKSGLPLVKSDDTNQIGHSFGERLANAIEEVFKQGYEQVIAIGNDCPNFSHQILQTATKQLTTQKMVIGPSTDGGAYLIGLHREAYQREQFLQLRWETDLLLEDLLSYGDAIAKNIYCLASQIDLDTENDLRRFLRTCRSPLFRSAILAILHINKKRPRPIFTLHSFLYHALSRLRAPPLF